MTIWYSSPEYRGMEIYIDGKYHDRLYCPITAEDYNTETISTKINLSAGKHKIQFTNSYSDAPDIDKIQLEQYLLDITWRLEQVIFTAAIHLE